MSGFTFTPASKPAGWPRVALVGPPGSGCEYTAHALARGFGGPVGVIDTTRTGGQYADLFDYSTIQLHTFNPETLTAAVAHAADQGIATLVVASLSPFWSGRDGMLEQVDERSKSGGSKNDAWAKMREVERTMTDTLLGFPGAVVATLRTRIEWVTEPDENGRVAPRAVGTKPDQRDGILYDFPLALAMHGGTGVVVASKYPSLTGEVVHHPGEAFAVEVLKAVGDGTVGTPFNPIAVRDWVDHPDRTEADLSARYAELGPRLLEAVVVWRDRVTNLDIVIRKRGSELRHAAAGTTQVTNPLDQQDG